ncbi:hypothetical protein VNO78_33729 [Psophocarpus tetragonolobus]|uniref:Uncharacterized protein n=1 Tax=Psophocarpus tetragonolobus TaxID=3891 RepID=A0AAN9RQC3_PSOTE
MSMHLNDNNLSGEIPSLTLCKWLITIDFGDNILQGTLPAWVGHNLHSLIVFRLRGNKMQGSIPTSLCNLLFLQVLDLSRNNITGEIPQCLSQIFALSNLKFPRKTIAYNRNGIADGTSSPSSVEEIIIASKGQNREYRKNLGFMTVIDLSSNHLTGEMPQSVTTLMALAGLNLSGNNLTGMIPNNIDHMKCWNHLTCQKTSFMEKSNKLFKFDFLSYINLSFNNLSG